MWHYIKRALKKKKKRSVAFAIFHYLFKVIFIERRFDVMTHLCFLYKKYSNNLTFIAVLRDDNLYDDIECVNKIFRRHGFHAWWVQYIIFYWMHENRLCLRLIC